MVKEGPQEETGVWKSTENKRKSRGRQEKGDKERRAWAEKKSRAAFFCHGPEVEG